MRVFLGSAGNGVGANTFFAHANFRDNSTSMNNVVILNKYNNLNVGPSRQIVVNLTGNHHIGRILMAKFGDRWMMVPATSFDMGIGATNSNRGWKPYFSSDNGRTWSACNQPFDMTASSGSPVMVHHLGCIQSGSARVWTLGIKYTLKFCTDPVNFIYSTVTNVQIFTSTDDGNSWTASTTASRNLLLGTGNYTAYTLSLTSNSAVRGNDQYTRNGTTFTTPSYSGSHEYNNGSASNVRQVFYNTDNTSGEPSSASVLIKQDTNLGDQKSDGTFQTAPTGWEYLNCGNNVWVRVQTGTRTPTIQTSFDDAATWTTEADNRFQFLHSGKSQAGYWSYPGAWQ